MAENIWSNGQQSYSVLEPIKTVELYQKPPSPKTFQRGEVIFREGETGKVIYGIIEGEVDLWVNGQVVETIKQGDIFGEGALVHQDQKRDETAIAKTDSLLAFLARQHFLFAVDQTPMFALEVMRRLGSYLIELESNSGLKECNFGSHQGFLILAGSSETSDRCRTGESRKTKTLTVLKAPQVVFLSLGC